MTNEHVSFHSIGQFRNVIKDAPKGVIEFTGTAKLHGTNASVVFTDKGGFYAQSRSRVITPEDDNYGFAKFAYDNQGHLERFKWVLNGYGEIIIFGEWCGKGIQSGVGISQLDRMFVVFAVKGNGKWINPKIWQKRLKDHFGDLKLAGKQIFSIYDFPYYILDINFEYPETAINRLAVLTQRVEEECPVAKQFGVSGTGEGIVWSNHEYGLIFKVKGEKHSVFKAKTLTAVDVEKIESIKEFVEYAVTENRLKQALAEVTPDRDIKKMGDFLRWVYNDIIKEESDTLAGNGLDSKEIGKYVSAKARTWFLPQL